MTAMAVARSGVLRGARVGELLKVARLTPVEHTTLEILLAHRSGLEANLPLFQPLVGGQSVALEGAVREACSAIRADAVGAVPQDGFAPLYSDLGYMLAGEAMVAALGAADMGEVVRQLVASPLGRLEELGSARDLEAYGERVGFSRRVVPTEWVSWRGGDVRGRVHDENAFALRGEGACGHAGVFGTVSAVLAFGIAAFEAIARKEGPLSTADDFGWMVRPRPGGTLRAGFDGKSEGSQSSVGARAGPRTFGHLGFTGTSLWIDPDAEAVVVLLTNRVYPTRNNNRIRTARPLAHDALFGLAFAHASNVDASERAG